MEQSPLVDENSDVADESRFGEVVGDVQHRTAPLEVDRPHLAPNGGPAARIERGKRLIEQEHVGPSRQGTRQRDELALATAQ